MKLIASVNSRKVAGECIQIGQLPSGRYQVQFAARMSFLGGQWRGFNVGYFDTEAEARAAANAEWVKRDM